MPKFDKSAILERLARLDGDLFTIYGAERRFEVVIIGGSALMMSDLAPTQRFTRDIDVLKSSKEAESLLGRYGMNNNASTFLYKYPQGWQARRVRIPFEGDVLDVYTMSPEDLAITKALAWRQADRDDLKNMAEQGSIDMDKLKLMIDDVSEVRANLDGDEWEELLKRLEAVKSWAIS